MSDTARIERAVGLLREAQVRCGPSAWQLLDAALDHLHAELADRMLADASAEITALVDIHGLIDDVGADFDADRKGWA